MNTVFLGATPLVSLVGIPLYVWDQGLLWWQPALCAALYAPVGLAITAGYHRHFAHKSYECHPAIQLLFLVFGAMAFQNSVLQWASDHREHHRDTDGEGDPYSVTKGFWWAHVGWVLRKQPSAPAFDNVADLLKNPLVVWQHRWCRFIGVGAGFGIPVAIGAALGHPLGGLLWGGILRIVLIHHSTFAINSIAHLWGSQPYSDESTARDNWLVALVTNGEGYHNFHHRFPADYRNGVRWYQFDPSKWLIASLRAAGLARDLRLTSKAVIEAARLKMELLRAAPRLGRASEEIRAAVQAHADRARQAFDRAATAWNEMAARQRELVRERRNAAALAHQARLSSASARVEALREAIRQKRRESDQLLLEARTEWRRTVQLLAVS